MGCLNSKEAGGKYVADVEGMGMIALGWERMMSDKTEKMSVMTGHWEVAVDRIDEDHHVSLGEGGFGVVYEGRVKGVGTIVTDSAEAKEMYSKVVIKKLTTGSERELRLAFLKEAQYMKEIEHPHLLRLVGVLTMEQPMLMMFESCPHGNLKTHLTSRRSNADLSPFRQAALARDVAAGMAYLSEANVVHTDLAARNCLLGKGFVAKVGDFGLARSRFGADYYASGEAGKVLPWRWMAPESIAASGGAAGGGGASSSSSSSAPSSSSSSSSTTTTTTTFASSAAGNIWTHASDVWSWGVTAWEVTSYANQPYPSCSNSEVASHVTQGKTLREAKETAPGLFAVLTRCWAAVPGERPKFGELVTELEALLPSLAKNDADFERPSSSEPASGRSSSGNASNNAGRVSADGYSNPQDDTAMMLDNGGQQPSQGKKQQHVEGYVDSADVRAKKFEEKRNRNKSLRGLAAFKEADVPEEALSKLAKKKVPELPRQALELQKTIGKGAFGEVKKAVYTDSAGKTVDCAVKTLKAGSLEDEADALLAEASLVAQFDHPNVVALLGQVSLEEPYMIIFEFLHNGSCYQYLRDLSEEPTLELKLKFSIDVARGMAHLAERHHVHRDLATRNVLVSSDLMCKISDFGLSRDLEDDMYYQSEGGMVPIRWTPPEAYKYKKYSTSSDIWSYGITMYEIWTKGGLPYSKDWTNLMVMMEVERGYRLPPPPDCPRAIYQLMVGCWNPARKSRPAFRELADKLELARDMLFQADGTVVAYDSKTDDLEQVYVGVPVPTVDQLDQPLEDLYEQPVPIAQQQAAAAAGDAAGPAGNSGSSDGGDQPVLPHAEGAMGAPSTLAYDLAGSAALLGLDSVAYDLGSQAHDNGGQGLDNNANGSGDEGNEAMAYDVASGQPSKEATDAYKLAVVDESSRNNKTVSIGALAPSELAKLTAVQNNKLGTIGETGGTTVVESPALKRKESLRKQMTYDKTEGSNNRITVHEESNRSVLDVLKKAEERQQLSALQEHGISKLEKEHGVQVNVDTSNLYIESTGKARDEVTASKALRGGACVCRRFKCVCGARPPKK